MKFVAAALLFAFFASMSCRKRQYVTIIAKQQHGKYRTATMSLTSEWSAAPSTTLRIPANPAAIRETRMLQ